VSAATDIAWRTTSFPPIDPARFGADHWSTFAYIETRIVDYRGTINHDHMRCHARRHPIMLAAKKARSGDGSSYPTRLAGDDQLPDHDDYDCLDDLISAGLLEAHMPELGLGFHVAEYFVDAYDRPILDPDGNLITADFVTGLTELWLCTQATFSLTERGAQVASALRQHKAAGGNFATFRLQ
jgi:hypothetical protein